MSAMSLAKFRLEVDRELRDLGLSRMRPMDKAIDVYGIDSGETVRFFGPHSMRRPWGCVLLGAVGFVVPAFSRSYGTSYYITNEDSFAEPVGVQSERDLPELAIWIKRIRDNILSLPSTIPEIAVFGESQPRRAALFRESSPEFWSSFDRWFLEQNASHNPSQ